MRHVHFQFVRCVAMFVAWCCLVSIAPAVDFESFEFNDANGTMLENAVNTANIGNNWFVDPDMTPSQVRTLSPYPSSYYIIKDNASADNNFLQIDDITAGTRYLTAKIAGWSFLENPEEVFRLAFLNSDTEPNFGNLITAQMSLVRISETEVELTGAALGTGVQSIANTATFAAEHPGAFEMTLELNKTANKFKVFYRDGSGASQVLGSGLIDPTREGRALRMQATGNFGDFNDFFPGDLLDFMAIDRLALTDTNPHTDLVTLEIDRDNGAVTLKNTSGAMISGIESYSIVSAAGGLRPAGWSPIGGGTNMSSNNELMQSFGGGGISLANGEMVPLSMGSGAWIKSPFEDVEMVLNLTGGETRTVNVDFIDNGGLRFMRGDFTFDNQITAADYLLMVGQAETDLTTLSIAEAYQQGDIDQDLVNSIRDFVAFKSLFEMQGGSGSFAAMLAGVPEPSAALLIGFAAAFGRLPRRRRQANAQSRTPSTSQPKTQIHTTDSGDSMMGRPFVQGLAMLFVAACISTAPREATAVILEDFTFSEPNTTALEDTENSANPGNGWFVDSTELNNSSVLDGSFRIQKGNVNAAQNYLDIENITTGKAWLVAEIAGWSLSSDTVNPDNFNPGELEQVRFAFLDNDNPPGFGSLLSGQVQFQRNAAGNFQLIGDAGAGGTAVAGTLPLSLVRSEPFTVVVEADVTDNVQQYSVYYKDGVGGSFTSLGNPGTIGAGRNLNALRFYVNNSFAGDGEFFDVNRIYLTDENPITDPVEPVTLSLIVNKTTRDVFLKNESDEAISFDSYRIESESSSLSFAGWESLSDRMPALDPFEGGDDPGEKWLKSVGSNDGVLAESFLLSFSTLDHDESLYLGKAFKMGGVEDLLFQYHELDGESVVTVAPTYITSAGVPGDYNENGIVDAADYTVWRDRLNQATTLPNTDVADVDNMVTLAEYNFWVSRFGMTSGAGSLSSNAAVPEPASGQIGAAVLLLAAALVRRRLGVD